MRGGKNTLANLTPNNIKASKSLIQKLEIAIKKMPDMNGTLVYRGDNWDGWINSNNKSVELKAFTSVSNNIDDTFISREKNMLIIIEGKKGKVKDITKLSIIPNFGEYFKYIKNTTNEGVILPNSEVIITNEKAKSYKGIEIIEIQSKQTK
ncbi:hypothetical protein BKN14_02720 [Candidatus Gracilibacteria bacterium HOT-871]|nr:hypothetical protein BKN14_02720 [Candidatus Gracilibacteria bacterium HOT-871]